MLGSAAACDGWRAALVPQACTGSAVPPGARQTRKRASTADMCAHVSVVQLPGCHPQLPVFFMLLLL